LVIYLQQYDLRRIPIMKKFLIFAMAAMLMVGAGSAYAKGGNGGGGNGGGMGAGMGGAGMQGMGNRLPADFQPVTQDQANKLAADYIDSNLKGYEVTSSGTFEGKRFTGYTYTVEDASGNVFNVIVNARGMVRGPFPVQK
jgi:membrane protease subunit (stomatin/prohibitin family)